jgi:RNA polymerase sigma factor (sigma-70 family)
MSERHDPARLLAHAGWVRVLATRLAREADRDDAVQDLWLAALRTPPDDERPARPWLAQVLANAARRRFRDESTRQRHEQAVEASEAPTSPEALVARAQLHELLVKQVLALEEPFRQTVLQRFFEGLSSEDIARQSRVPSGTVRWRLKEGLDRVRASLDAQYGDRSAWLLALTPLVLPPPGSFLTTGVVLMKNKVQIAVVVALVASGSFLATSASSLNLEPSRPFKASVPHSEPRLPGPPAAAADLETGRGSRAPPPALSPLVAATPPPALATPPPAPPHSAKDPTPMAPALAATVPAPAADAGVRFALDRAGLRAAIHSARPKVGECYNEWRKLDPSLGGKFVVSFTIDTDDGVEGRVSRISAFDAGVGNVPFEGCVLASLQDLRFEPPLDGPLNVRFPFLFDAADAGAR